MAMLAVLAACIDSVGSFRLDLSLEGAGTLDPAPGSRRYSPGSEVRVRATAASGATFMGWSGAATGAQNPISVLMDSDKALTAHFSGGGVVTYVLTVASEGSGATSPLAGTHSYASGTTVSASATPASGATFTGWSGAATGMENPISILMDSDKALTAHFSGGGAATHVLTVASEGSGTTSPAPGAHSYASGTTVSVTATPVSGATFTGWSGAATGTQSPVSIVMDSDKALTARFSGASAEKSGLPAPPGGGVARPTGTPGNLTVIDWAGFKAAVSFTFDDSQPSQIEHYAELQAVGVPMTFYTMSSVSSEANYDATWSKAVRDGHEIGNHTVNHCNADFRNCNNHLSSPLEELDADTGYITQNFKQSAVWTMAAPYGDSGWVQYAKQRFFVNRGVGYGMIAPKDNTDPFSLPVYQVAANDTSSKFSSLIDTAHGSNKWLIFLIHSILPTQANWYAGTNVSVITGGMSRAKASGDIWVDTLVNVAAYWRAQKLLSSLSPSVSGSTRTWTWTLPEHFPPGKFVRVKVDGGTLKQGGSTLAWDEHGYYEVALSAGSLILSP
jgi:peptidoglycan/xylan/chitin deacetylase (PgdA/CDA1 family)